LAFRREAQVAGAGAGAGMQFAFASEWFGICLFEPWWDLSLQQKSVGFWWIFWEGGWISNKRYASRGRRKRVHGSLGGGSVDAWICVSLLGPVSVAACFIYRQLTRLRSAQSDDNVFLELLRSFGAIYILVAGFGCSIVRYPNPVEYTALCIRSLSVARAGVAIKAARS